MVFHKKILNFIQQISTANIKPAIVLAGLALVLLQTPVFAANNTILVFGDSLSAGYGLARDEGWTHLLQNRLQEHAIKAQIVNASISGETTSGGLSRLADTLKQHQPKLVILELGANDGLRGLPVRDMQTNLAQMISLCQQQKAVVLLLGMRIPPNYGGAYSKAFSASYSSLAQQFKVALVPFFLDGVAGNPALIQDDGLHPLAIAQPKLLDNIWLELQPMLKRWH
jgi:acyl-CoA thioesterase I